jgi:hypothetical protein
MSQTLIERISQAVYAKGLEPPSREVLIAVIEAMRETTPEIEACFDKYVDEAPRWSELIDAALESCSTHRKPSTS